MPRWPLAQPCRYFGHNKYYYR
ncbi:hypothetical protein [Sodalis sp.]